MNTPRLWTVAEIRSEMGEATILAHDGESGAAVVPPGLETPGRSEPAMGWQAQSLGVDPADKADLVGAWWAAIDEPGRIQQVAIRRRCGDAWRTHLTKVLDLRHQSEIGVILVATSDLGPIDAKLSGHADCSALVDRDSGVAHFERPVWLLAELDGSGVVLNTEGDVATIYGRDPADVVGQPALEFIHPADHPACREMWVQLLADDAGSRTIRQRVVRPDGSERWIESTVMNRLGADRSGSVLSISHDVTERRRQERDLRRRAMTDPLTGLPNRYAVEAALEEMTTSGSATVAFIDLDGFKQVNDIWGHHIGDQVLDAIGWRLHNAVRGSSTDEPAMAGRWGGDEFVLIAPGECEAALRSAIDQSFADPVSTDEEQWHPSCSYGMALGGPGSEPGALVRSADTAMYAAKECR